MLRYILYVISLSLLLAACARPAGPDPRTVTSTAESAGTPTPTPTPSVVEVTREVEVPRLVEVTRLVEMVVEVTATPTPSATPSPTQAQPGSDRQPLPSHDDSLTRRELFYRGRILFFSEDPALPGWYTMDPDGSNRTYLDSGPSPRDWYEGLRQTEAEHIDEHKGLCRTYTTTGPEDELPQIYAQCEQPAGEPTSVWRVSQGLVRTSYDPVWSPDGRRIAFVSQNMTSDDIYIADAYTGENIRNLMPNEWEWDKHPSWSPDSTRLVFWSNRTGQKQLYIVDVQSGEITQPSSTDWDEYDPVWIK